MNDTMDNTTGDDAVIARLRSALDEVAASGGATSPGADELGERSDGSEAPVIALRTTAAERRPGRAWLGVAAATAVLVGAGGWALTQRSTPTATGQSTTVAPMSTAIDAGSATRPEGHTGPWYELRLADAVPGSIESGGSDNSTSGFTQQWMIGSPDGVPGSFGVLSILVRYDELGVEATADAGRFRQIAAPQGTAWLQNDPLDPASGSPLMVWKRDDGTVWWVQQANLVDPADADGTAFADYVFAVEQGTFNDLLNNPDTRSEWIGTAPTNLRVEHMQTYAVGGVDTAAVLGVSTSLPLERLIGITDITEVTVAGSRAWRGTQADGEVTVVWPIDGEWWGLLRISPELTDRIDEVLATVTPAAANMPGPEPAKTTLVPVTDPVAPPESTTAPTENAVRTDYPDLSIVSARIAPGPIEVAPAPPVDALGQVWRVQSESLDGLLLMNVVEAVADEEYLAEQGWKTITALEGVTEGRAWLAEGRGDDPASDQTVVVWARPEGVTWGFSWVGPTDSSTDEWIDLVLSATPGSGVPVVIADERATVLSVVGPPTTMVARTFTDVEGATATLTLWDSAMLLNRLLGAEAPTEIEVDGRTGWRVDDLSLGWALIYWDAGDGWFAELRFDQGLASLADEIIASNLVRLDG